MNDMSGAMPSFSYQGQDSFVMDVLQGKTGGFFLDSGASNGRKGSNTWLMESQFGWRGICVEPNAAFFQQLCAQRACICLNCCLFDRDGPVDFLEAAGVYGGIIDQYDAHHLSFTRRVLGARWPDGLQAPTVSKDARSIRSVLREAGAPQTIDYWSLDTEGSELTLLKCFPYDEYRFRVLTVEHNNGPIRHAIREFLQQRGYVWARDLGIDDGYVLADDSGQAWRSAAWRARRGARV
ncbi:MAG: FkbM family methyltransferase [Pseudomonadota bacterium]